MKRISTLFITIALFGAAAAAGPRKQACSIPYEVCQTGCPELGAYSLAAFASTPAEQAFVAALTPLQQETVRRTTFASSGAHIVIAYRVLAGQTPVAAVTIGLCDLSTVTLRGFVAMETAAVEADHLPIDQRASVALFSAFPAPTNDPNTHALLIARQEAGNDDVDH
jgi:hypothetical protein